MVAFSKLRKIARSAFGVMAHPSYHRPFGRCNVCRKVTCFICARPENPWIRTCVRCRSTPKYRAIIAAIERRIDGDLGRFLDSRERSLYEMTTSSSVYRVHGHRPNYRCSGYFSDRPFDVEIRPRVWNADVQALPFDERSFDIVISSETFEHVRDPWAGFRELRRVLKPGGFHVFTIPYHEGRPTFSRVDIAGQEDRFPVPKIYHEDPYNEIDSLVYTDFGDDLGARLEELGYRVEMLMIREQSADIQDDLAPVRVFVAARN